MGMITVVVVVWWFIPIVSLACSADGCLLHEPVSASYRPIDALKAGAPINNTPSHEVNLHKKVGFDSSHHYLWTAE